VLPPIQRRRAITVLIFRRRDLCSCVESCLDRPSEQVFH